MTSFREILFVQEIYKHGYDLFQRNPVCARNKWTWLWPLSEKSCLCKKYVKMAMTSFREILFLQEIYEHGYELFPRNPVCARNIWTWLWPLSEKSCFCKKYMNMAMTSFREILFVQEIYEHGYDLFQRNPVCARNKWTWLWTLSEKSRLCKKYMNMAMNSFREILFVQEIHEHGYDLFQRNPVCARNKWTWLWPLSEKSCLCKKYMNMAMTSFREILFVQEINEHGNNLFPKDPVCERNIWTWLWTLSEKFRLCKNLWMTVNLYIEIGGREVEVILNASWGDWRVGVGFKGYVCCT